ncbi:hypothetical protein ZIOFF_011283 [Zingiber officinale]|uniref:Uncharacterized protein n=1 Tax=Zingiber officinale TaxID=94328 RepID=A0A8J5HIL0_ZINOF|nr:hypothetical protein ZIOFF_011283 [Zingiber officinale]
MWRETLGLKFSPGLVRRLREIAIQRDGAALSFFSCFGFKQRNYRLFVAYKYILCTTNRMLSNYHSERKRQYLMMAHRSHAYLYYICR